ncbi:Monocarboxylate transporter 7 [Halotydeus destructor]|nr:Monocarboxylate transporter 7 [Halotydeus destructor]
MVSKVDRGPSWSVALACCFISGVLFGVYRSYGLLYSVLVDTLHINRSAAAWPFSLCMTVIHLTGPVSGVLNQRFTTRSIMFAGCSLAALGTMLCYTAHSIVEFTVYVGIVQGFGIGLTYVQSTAIINQYFDKYRSRANGICLSGGTMGAFFLSYLVEWSLRHLRMNTVFLILSVVTMTTFPICWLLKPFEYTKEEDKVDSYEKVVNIASIYLKGYDISPVVPTNCNNNITPLKFVTRDRRDSVLFNPMKQFGKLMIDAIKEIERKMSVGSLVEDKETKTTEDAANATKDKGENICSNVMDILRRPMFLMIASTHMAYFWSCITYMMIICDYASDKNIPVDKSVQLISAFSLGDLLGRLGSGWVMDKQLVSGKILALMSSVGIGVLLQMTTVTDDFVIFMVISCSLGLLSGLMNVLLNSLFCSYISPQKASLSFGLSCFLCGLVTLGRPAVVGYYRDSESGSYDGLLSVLGVISCAVGSLWLFEPCFRPFDKMAEDVIKDKPEAITS